MENIDLSIYDLCNKYLHLFNNAGAVIYKYVMMSAVWILYIRIFVLNETNLNVININC